MTENKKLFDEIVIRLTNIIECPMDEAYSNITHTKIFRPAAVCETCPYYRPIYKRIWI